MIEKGAMAASGMKDLQVEKQWQEEECSRSSSHAAMQSWV
jgi:hypothetical protein